MSDPEGSDAEVALYRFIPDATACDICQSMEGEYEDTPYVPVHFKCNCQVVRLAEADDNCTYEVLDLAWETEYYDETRYLLTLEIDPPLPADTYVGVDINYGTEAYSFDEGVRQAAEDLGWEEESHTARISQSVPAGTTSVEIYVTYRMASSLFRGERRKACATDNADGSVTTNYEYLGSVGGMALASEIDSFDMRPDSGGGGTGGEEYFEDGDEVPV